MKKVLLPIALLFSTPAIAQQVVEPNANSLKVEAPVYLREIKECNAPDDVLWSFCATLYEKTPNIRDMEGFKPGPGYPKYEYQRLAYEAACIKPTDSKEVRTKKIQAMWARFGDKIVCGPMGEPPEGHPIKYAANGLFDFFIMDVIVNWQIDLNKVEPDGTILDFLAVKIAKSTELTKRNMCRYYHLLRRAGAKHTLKDSNGNVYDIHPVVEGC